MAVGVAGGVLVVIMDLWVMVPVIVVVAVSRAFQPTSLSTVPFLPSLRREIFGVALTTFLTATTYGDEIELFLEES